MRRRSIRWASVAIAQLLLASCWADSRDGQESLPPSLAAEGGRPEGRPGEILSRDAKVDAAQMMEDDLSAARHPSDGGGKGWRVVPGPGKAPLAPLRVGERHAFHLVYEAGPLGIAVGGMLFLQASPFWQWDSPQTLYEEAPGYTTVSTTAEGVELLPVTVGDQFISIEIAGRPLAAGEQVELHYGAGPAGARVDHFAEREERIWFAVDGDGDGVRATVQDSTRIDIEAGPAARLELTLPSTAQPGQEFELVVAVLDHVANAGVHYEGSVLLTGPPGIELPDRVDFTAADAGTQRISLHAQQVGIFRLRGRSEGETGVLEGASNPLVVREGVTRVLWADLHGHSQLSDGTGTPEDYFRYARDIAALDAVALTDHDHWGMQFLDTTPELWQDIQDTTLRFHDPGRFVTILGYEWTSWLHGHRHVLYFSDTGRVLSSLDPNFRNPAQLWEGLRGKAALTFAHHSAGGPVSTNWYYAPDPVLEPITEVTSVHGSSEAMDSARPIYSPVPGNFVRDALDHGFRFGFVGSGDGHDGHPGLAQLSNPSGSGGLAAILSEENTRAGILEALRSRRVYATDGPRIWLDATLDGHPMGAVLPAGEHQGPHRLALEISAPFPILSIDLIRGSADPDSPPGEVVHREAGEGRSDWEGLLSVPQLAAGDYLYLRVVLENSSSAWSSPFYGGTQLAEQL